MGSTGFGVVAPPALGADALGVAGWAKTAPTGNATLTANIANQFTRDIISLPLTPDSRRRMAVS